VSAETIAIGAAAAACAMAWAVFILAPAWTSYGRLWERVAASFLTLFVLATLLGIGDGSVPFSQDGALPLSFDTSHTHGRLRAAYHGGAVVEPDSARKPWRRWAVSQSGW